MFFSPYAKLRRIDTSLLTKYSGKKSTLCIRSQFEFYFLARLEKSSRIVQYDYECVRIAYTDWDGKLRKYVPDFLIYFREGSNPFSKALVEVKPLHHIFPPILEMSKLSEREKIYYQKQLDGAKTNLRKFEAASQFAKDNFMDFVIFTEKGFISIDKTNANSTT
jgi:hypothetical protein